MTFSYLTFLLLVQLRVCTSNAEIFSWRKPDPKSASGPLESALLSLCPLFLLNYFSLFLKIRNLFDLEYLYALFWKCQLNDLDTSKSCFWGGVFKWRNTLKSNYFLQGKNEREGEREGKREEKKRREGREGRRKRKLLRWKEFVGQGEGNITFPIRFLY